MRHTLHSAGSHGCRSCDRRSYDLWCCDVQSRRTAFIAAVRMHIVFLMFCRVRAETPERGAADQLKLSSPVAQVFLITWSVSVSRGKFPALWLQSEWKRSSGPDISFRASGRGTCSEIRKKREVSILCNVFYGFGPNGQIGFISVFLQTSFLLKVLLG